MSNIIYVNPEFATKDMLLSEVKRLNKIAKEAYKELALSNKQLRALDKSYLPMNEDDWKEELDKRCLVEENN